MVALLKEPHRQVEVTDSQRNLLSSVAASMRGTCRDPGGTKERVFRFVWVLDSVQKEMTVEFGFKGIRIC